MKVNWNRVIPATTTQLKDDLSLDLGAQEQHIDRLVAAGVGGISVCGTIGENYALTPAEKRQVLEIAVKAADGRVPVLAGVAETTSELAGQYARDCEKLGADGLMVLPPLVSRVSGRESMAYHREVAEASGLPIMIYNNPVSYGTDITPELFAELADEPKFVAIKESANDIRRITDTIKLTGDRYIHFAGIDDLVIESVVLGAKGYVAGMVNAFPEEVVSMFDLALAGRHEEAVSIYRWMMPLLHLDNDPKVVHFTKLAQELTGLGSATVRKPRLPLDGAERARAEGIVRTMLETRPERSEALRQFASG